MAVDTGVAVEVIGDPKTSAERHDPLGLTDILYQRDGEIIAFARPDLAVSGTGSSSVAQVVDRRDEN